ncbi:MAG: serine/threonine-protein kinase [Myxococcota bacterium]
MRLDDRYDVLEERVQDASGSLHRGWDAKLGREVCIKRFAGDPHKSPRWRRFVREARVLATVRQQGLPELFDVRDEGDKPYMVLAALSGVSLRAHVDEHGPLSLTAAKTLISQLCEVLGAAHRVGVVHRDVRPEFVFIDGSEVSLVGFGRALGQGSPGTYSDVSEMVRVSPYVAPEVVLGAPADPRSDVYGIAAVGYFAMTGKDPFDTAGASIGVALGLINNQPPPRVEGPPAVADALQGAMAKRLENRPSTTAQLRRGLVRSSTTAPASQGGPASELPVGLVLEGKYRVLGEIGRGGTSVVVLAEDQKLQRLVAIKVLKGGDVARVERFVDEARAMAAVRHPNVVSVHALIAHEERPMIVMEHIPGRSVADLLEQGRAPLEDAVVILDQTAAGLAAVHDAGITHRDVKPSNVLVGPAFRVALADFGLVERETPSSGKLWGTPGYIAPERLAGTEERDLAARVDLYSLGVMAYELLTGQLPFEASDPAKLTEAQLAGNVIPPSQRGAPAGFDALVLSALAVDPKERITSATRFRAELAQAAKDAFGGSESARILAVGLRASTREVLDLAMDRPGLASTELHAVSRGEDAIKAMESDRFDVVVVGSELQDWRCVELAAWIRAVRAEPPPMMVVTHDALSLDLQELDALGVRGCLRSPIEVGVLVANLRRLLRRSL